jgi:3-oxosteroid 1-dehydrogenase
MSTIQNSPATPLGSLAPEYDVVVMGSGAAGLTAAVRAADAGLSVLVLEKAGKLGGTTAAGGGVIWAPNNPLAAAAGFNDSHDAGVAYLRAAAGHAMDEDSIDWFVRTAPEAVDFLERRTRVSLTPLARPDYHMEWPGSANGGRGLDNKAFSAQDYPGLAELLRPSSYFPLLTMAERDELNGRSPDPKLLRSRAATGVRTMGGALAGSLAASALDKDVTIAVEAPVTKLFRGEAGHGWTVKVQGGTAVIRAAAVVIASGGFEWNERLRRAFLPLPVVPIGAPSNEGDGLELGLAAGATAADMTAVWGVPVIAAPTQRYDGKPSGRMGNVEMTLPGSITVNGSGRRFVNEALNYHDASRVFANIDPDTLRQQNNPAWLVFDSEYLDKYPVAGSSPGRPEEWMIQADTVAGLAEAIGVNAGNLQETVSRFNEDAEAGVDAEFGRGGTPQDLFLGDDTNKPNPCLAPLRRGPFFAVPLHAGVLGTSGGLATDLDGRVLDRDRQPIAGLYAAGNVSAGVFRNNYPGGGATLGSAVVRAYAAGTHLATAPTPCAAAGV